MAADSSHAATGHRKKKETGMETIKIEMSRNIATIRLDNGPTNAINLQVLKDLNAALDEIMSHGEAGACILAAAGEKFFSIGFDLPELYDVKRDEFSVFYRSYNRFCLRLFTLPLPTIAEIGGHAVAGGCILALCCDYRFIAKGRKLMGLNEVKLGVPVPYPASCILRDIAGVRRARELMETGEFHEPDALLTMGLVDGVYTRAKLHPQAMAKAAALAGHPHMAWETIKRNRVAETEEEINAKLADHEQRFIDLWYSEEARKSLREAMDRY
ncbi:MAG: hypothetical protein GF355_00995 [Candidatus Eisenbacteria bacterium]|nr:hypothetical protein [Candidatus Eisenbacteria bacterium]